MEPRVAIGDWDEAAQKHTLISPTQGAVKLQNGLADIVFKVPKAQVHVISPDTGGGFGLRGKLFPETVMVTWAAKRLKRPVKWLADRGETFVCDPHGRDHLSVGEIERKSVVEGNGGSVGVDLGGGGDIKKKKSIRTRKKRKA